MANKKSDARRNVSSHMGGDGREYAESRKRGRRLSMSMDEFKKLQRNQRKK